MTIADEPINELNVLRAEIRELQTALATLIKHVANPIPQGTLVEFFAMHFPAQIPINQSYGEKGHIRKLEELDKTGAELHRAELDELERRRNAAS
jgi:hypothetical protein